MEDKSSKRFGMELDEFSPPKYIHEREKIGYRVLLSVPSEKLFCALVTLTPKEELVIRYRMGIYCEQLTLQKNK